MSFMSDALVLAASIRTTLLEVAKQAEALGSGLQNAAQPGMSSNSVSYLLFISENIQQAAEECVKLQSLSSTSKSPKS